MPSPLKLRQRLKRAMGRGAPPPSEPPSGSAPAPVKPAQKAAETSTPVKASAAASAEPVVSAEVPAASEATVAGEAAAAPLKVAPPAGTVARPSRAQALAAAKASKADDAAGSNAAGTNKVSQEKIEKHRKKTRKGVLKWLDEQEGGEASMKDMHDFSERRYFVSHKPFSDLMEYLIDNVLITFDHGAGIATITDDGRDFYKS